MPITITPLADAPTVAVTAPGSVITGEVAAATNEALAHSSAVGTQNRQAMTALENGEYVVIWEEVGGNEIAGQKFDSSGNKVGGEFSITDSSQITNTAISSLEGGGFVVVYAGNSPGARDVFAQRFDNDGGALGGTISVNTFTSDNQHQADVAGLSDGSFVVTFLSFEGGNWDIFAQRYSAAGAAVGSNFRVDPFPASGNQVEVAITELSDGGYAIVWVGQRNRQQDLLSTIQLLRPNGGIGCRNRVRHVGSVAIDHELTDGNILVVWRDVAVNDISARIFDSSGTAVGAEFTVKHVRPPTRNFTRQLHR